MIGDNPALRGALNEQQFKDASVEDRTEWALRELWLNEPGNHVHGPHMNFTEWVAAGKPKRESGK